MKSAVKWLAAAIGFFAIPVLIAVAYLAVLLVPLEQLVGRVTHICSPANVAGPIERPTYPNVP